MRSASTILIVEDDTEIRDLLQEALEMEGYRSLIAANGQEAMILLADSVHPNAIVLDLMMPRMNGWEFLKAKRADDRLRGIPVLLLTAVGDGYFDPTLADAVIKKPIDLEILFRAIRKHCND